MLYSNNGNKSILRAAAAIAVMITGGQILGENLIFNSGFELGDGGYSCVKYLRLETNPSMKYEGAVIDTNVSASGKQSLRIPNRFAEQFRVFAREVKLAPGKEYTFSMAVKSDTPGSIVNATLVSASTSFGWHSGGKKVTTNGQWQRCSFSIKVPTDRKYPYYSLFISSGFDNSQDEKRGNVWLDSLQLVQGKELPYQPFEGVELVVVPEQALYMSGAMQTGKVRTSLVNNTNRELKLRLALEMIAETGGNFPEFRLGGKTPLTPVEITLAPHERKTVNSNVPLSRLGAYVVKPVVVCPVPVSSEPGYVAVVGKYERKPINLDDTFCVALVHGGAGGFVESPAYAEMTKKSYRTAVGMDEYLQMLGDMGCRLLRDLDYPAPLFRWNQIEKEPGKMDFRFTDMAVDAAARHGIAILPILIESTKRYMPSWCADQFTIAKPYNRRMKSLEGKTYMPPIKLWREYVRKLAGHYRGRISHYEIGNEPNLYFAPEDYIELLKAAHEEIRKVDPQLKIIGFCSTGDLGGALSDYLEKCFQLGGLNYADIVSFHPYDAPNFYSVTAADRQIIEVKKILRKFSPKNIPLWNTEIYYLTGKGNDYVTKGEYCPADAAQRFLTDLGEGLGQSISVPGETVFRKHCTPHFQAAICTTMVYPNSNFVVYNALARFFEGAKPVEKIRWGSDAICYVYTRKGQTLAAFWNYGGMEGLKMTLNVSGGDAALYDLYGNRIDLKKQPLELTAEPYYLTWNGDRGELIKRLREATIDADKPVVAGTIARLLPDRGTWQVAIGLKNSSGREVSGKAGIQGNGMIGQQIVDFTIPAGTLKTVFIPVKLTNDGIQSATAKVYVNRELWEFPVQVSSPAKTYLIRPDGGKAEPVLRSTGNKKAEHQATFNISSDKQNLLLSVFVKDKTPSGKPSGRHPWEQDCIELFFDAEPGLIPEKHPTAYHEHMGRLFILPYAEPDNQLILRPRSLKKLTQENVKCVVETTPDGYTVKLSIPLDALCLPSATDGRLLGFDMAVDNADGGEKAVQQLQWNSAGDAHKNRCSFGFLEFTK